MATDIADYNTFVQNLAAAGHAAIQAYSAGFNVVGCTEDTDARDNTSTTFTNTDKGVPIYWLNGTKAADDYEDFYDGSWDDEANDKAETGVDRLDTSQFNNLPWTGCEHDGTEAFRVFSRALGNSDGNRPVVLLGVPGSNNPQNGPLSSSSAQVPGFQLPVYGLSAVFQVAAEVLINKPPAFPSATAARSVAENTAPGQNVGAALTATDADSHTLTYTLEGTDAASFDIVTAAASARIRTKTGVTYNHEAKSTYTVIVKADDSNGGTATVTVTITVTDVNEPPGRPAAPSVTATVGLSTSLDVTWTAPSNTGPAITSYDLQYRQGTSGPFTAGPQDVPGTSGAIASLAQGTSYEVQVRATNAEGDGEWSFEGTGQPGTTVPDAPTGLVATASGPTKINLSWTAPASDGGFPITGYKIEVSSDGGSSWAGHLATTGNPATTYSHTGLARDTTRHYRVSAINTSGAGTPSNVDDATTTTEVTVPGAPTEFVASSDGTDKINLTWTAPASDGGSAITGYRIEVSSDGGSSWSDHVANTRSTTTTYAHTGLSPGDTRHYRVSAINTIGAGTPSNVDGATTASTRPSRPTGLSATASGNTQINLTWVAPASDGGSPITGYRIEISSDGGSSWTDQVADTTSADTTYSHTGLSPGDTRHYRVSAINTNGAGRPSNVDGATTEATEPGAPTGLSATASGTTQINLTWTVPASDGGSPITGYRIEISSDGGSSWTDQVANTRRTNTTYSHTGLAPGDTRHYRVSAINTNGAGPPSNVDDATTDTTVPGAPTGLSATASDTTKINLTWTAPASDGGSAITGYRIEVSSNGGSSWSDRVADTRITTTTYSHTGLSALNDPISDYLPEFKTMHVAVDETSPVNGRRVSYTVPADRQITVRDLFMHTAGLSYQGPKAPDGEPYFAKTGVNSATTLEEMDKRIAKAPLVQQPGTTWQYGYSTDVLARYVEVVSGMPIDAFFSKNIFEPLWMSDTGYYVPNTKWDRFTVLYSLNQGKKTVRRSTAAAQDSYKQPTTKLGGGSGLVSTTMDYARFCQMLANDGELDGVRILSRKSVELMRADHMPLDMPRAGGTISAGWGFGLTFAVNRGPGLTGMIGTEGEYRWGGAAGTRFWIDPKEEMVTIFMVQILPYRGLSYGREFKRLAYQAIVD